MHVVKNATLINSDIYTYLVKNYYIGRFIEELYEYQEIILPRIDKNKYLTNTDGVFYTEIKELHSTAFVSGFHKISDKIKDIVFFTEPIEDRYKEIMFKNPEIVQLYYMEKHSYIRIYPPIDALSEYNPKTDFEQSTPFIIANKENNPFRVSQIVKSPVIEKIDGVWSFLVVAPVYFNEEMQGVSGMRVSVNFFLEKWLVGTSGFFAFLLTERGLMLSTNSELKSILNDYSDDPENDTTIYCMNLLQHDDLEKSDIAMKILNGEKSFITTINQKKYYILCEEISLLSSYLVYMKPSDINIQ